MKKIMFNDKYGLTNAVLEGRKKQTRRFVKLGKNQYVNVVALDNGSFLSYVAEDGKPSAFTEDVELPNYAGELSPSYFIGEDVAVAQSYHDAKKEVGGLKGLLEGHPLPSAKGINNKMFVKADIMPHRIRITNVRVERLQDISEEDCLKEGVIAYDDIIFGKGYMLDDYYNNNYRRRCFTTARKAFSSLIDKVSGKGTWDSNPWVFVYDFELIK